MAAVGLTLNVAVLVLLGILMVTDGASRLFHLDQQVFNVIAIMVVLLCSKVIVDMVCVIRHGRLL
jgi:choline-glycine betaine transporter